MIEVYVYTTPNSIKVAIALEELGLDYTLRPVNVKQGEQKQDGFLALNPNARVPVLVQTDTATGERLVLSESAAILVYLAERQAQLLPIAGIERARAFEQLFLSDNLRSTQVLSLSTKHIQGSFLIRLLFHKMEYLIPLSGILDYILLP